MLFQNGIYLIDFYTIMLLVFTCLSYIYKDCLMTDGVLGLGTYKLVSFHVFCYPSVLKTLNLN